MKTIIAIDLGKHNTWFRKTAIRWDIKGKFTKLCPNLGGSGGEKVPKTAFLKKIQKSLDVSKSLPYSSLW